jgi:hypothetical protein
MGCGGGFCGGQNRAGGGEETNGLHHHRTRRRLLRVREGELHLASARLSFNVTRVTPNHGPYNPPGMRRLRCLNLDPLGGRFATRL